MTETLTLQVLAERVANGQENAGHIASAKQLRRYAEQLKLSRREESEDRKQLEEALRSDDELEVLRVEGQLNLKLQTVGISWHPDHLDNLIEGLCDAADEPKFIQDGSR